MKTEDEARWVFIMKEWIEPDEVDLRHLRRRYGARFEGYPLIDQDVSDDLEVLANLRWALNISEIHRARGIAVDALPDEVDLRHLRRRYGARLIGLTPWTLKHIRFARELMGED